MHFNSCLSECCGLLQLYQYPSPISADDARSHIDLEDVFFFKKVAVDAATLWEGCTSRDAILAGEFLALEFLTVECSGTVKVPLW